MLQCNLTELLQLALCKGETSLDAAFIDAGFTFNKHDRKLQGELRRSVHFSMTVPVFFPCSPNCSEYTADFFLWGLHAGGLVRPLDKHGCHHAGTDAALAEAFKDKNALHKLRHLIRGIVKGGHTQTLAYHWFGRHRLQHMIQAASTYRLMAQQFEVSFTDCMSFVPARQNPCSIH